MKEPSTGELNRRVSIKTWQDMPAMGGGITPSYGVGIPAWAEIEPVGNAIFFGTKQVGEGVTHRITIRRSTQLTERTITAEHVVDHTAEGVTLRYRVKRATALNGGRDFVMMEVEELGNA